MLLELGLVLPSSILICYVHIRYKHVINMMSSLDNLLVNLTDERFDDNIPEEGVCKKLETLKDAIQYRKVHFLPGKKGKLSNVEIERKTDQDVEKLYNMYMQRGTQVKCEMAGGVMSMQKLKLYLGGISKVLKIDDKKELRRENDENPIIKDNMAYTGPLILCTFGPWLPLILIGCHTASHTIGVNDNILETYKRICKL